MTTDAKTVLEWTYEPKDLFEVPCTTTFVGGKITITNGCVRGEFNEKYYEQGRKFREQAHAHVNAALSAQQVQVHQNFKLSEASMSREYADGRRDITAFIEPITVKMSVSHADFIVRNAVGEIIQDTKAERLQKQSDFRKMVVDIAPSDPALIRMLQSFKNALGDYDNFLIHLYEVREVLTSNFDNETTLKTVLSISSADWRRFGRLANNEPVKEGRHRGKHLGLRPAKKAEVEWALSFTQRMIEAYVTSRSDGNGKDQKAL
jgi:hypothetical protein